MKKACKIDGCDKPVKGHGWCNMHWYRWKRHGDPHFVSKQGVDYRARTPGPERLAKRPRCQFEGCDRPSQARGWCKTHWARWRKHGDPSIVLKVGVDFGVKKPSCEVEGCDRPYHARGCCTKHFRRLQKHGDPLIVGEVLGRPLKGEHPSWAAVHKQLSRERGVAAEYTCVDCSQPAKEWSYDHQAVVELVDAKTGCPYALDLDRYLPRCVPCHRRFDIAHQKQNVA